VDPSKSGGMIRGAQRMEPSPQTNPAAPARIPISGCVIAHNEHDRIADCLRSLAFCDDVVVVDSGSTDGTDRIARDLGARVVTNAPFPGHKEQKQFAVELARHDWVFCLDADERASQALVARVRELAAAAALAGAGYEFPRQNYYLGRILRFGLHVPDRKLRLFDRRRARWGGLNPHDHVEPAAGAAVARIDAPIVHLSYRDAAHHRATRAKFADIAAQALFAAGRRATTYDRLVRPPAVFCKSLLLKLGFLDGWRGLAQAATSAHYVWLKYRRLATLADAAQARAAAAGQPPSARP
jgi:glycosyltransferase involved in cell wall biosynthesis